MYQIQSLHGILASYDTRDIDLARSLADHVNINVPLCQCSKHAARDADHILQLAHE
jgi:hypothetical protein